jgi:hypothetical protein
MNEEEGKNSKFLIKYVNRLRNYVHLNFKKC